MLLEVILLATRIFLSENFKRKQGRVSRLKQATTINFLTLVVGDYT